MIHENIGTDFEFLQNIWTRCEFIVCNTRALPQLNSQNFTIHNAITSSGHLSQALSQNPFNNSNSNSMACSNEVKFLNLAKHGKIERRGERPSGLPPMQGRKDNHG